MMLGYSSHTTPVSSHQIPRNVASNWTGLDTELAADDQESGAAARGVEGSHAITGQPLGPNQGDPLYYPYLFPLHLVGPEYLLE